MRVRVLLIVGIVALAGGVLRAQAQNPFTGEGDPPGRGDGAAAHSEGDTGQAAAEDADSRSGALRDGLISFGAGRPLFPRLNAFLRAQQRTLNARIAGLIREATGETAAAGAAPAESGEAPPAAEGSAAAVLVIGLVAFLYGLLHAALPGHRKVLLVSYFVSADAPVRYGVFAGLGVAAVHSLAAVAVVLGAYYVLEASLSVALDDATRYLQAVTAAGILLVGAFLVVSKAREALGLRAGRSAGPANDSYGTTSAPNGEHRRRHEREQGHQGQGDGQRYGSGRGDKDRHDHQHDHAPAHPPQQEHHHEHHHEHGAGLIRRMKGRVGLLPAIVISAVVPCPGSAMILIFALSLGVVSLGLYAVVLFSVGMAVTLTAVSVVAVLSKRAVLGAFDGRLGEVLHVGIEGVAGMVMIAFGLGLLLPFL